jgi:hypothetical protein
VLENTDALGRRSRIAATSTGKRLTPTSRDILWFAKLAEHGPLPSSFLLAYAKHSHASEKRATERLGDLFHEDNTPDSGPYLTRPVQQFRTIDSRYNQLVYDLAPAGWQALQRNGIDTKQHRAPSGPWLHRFMTASITASIELATMEREYVTYIPQSAILARAHKTLRFPVSIICPATHRPLTRDIIPDALFGLQYHTPNGDRFRFFAVEADRATEPATTSNFNRKSALRSLLQYQVYVEEGLYKEHLKLTAPLLVLQVVTEEKRMKQLVDLTAKLFPHDNAYQLFQPTLAPVQPVDGRLGAGWARATLY